MDIQKSEFCSTNHPLCTFDFTLKSSTITSHVYKTNTKVEVISDYFGEDLGNPRLYEEYVPENLDFRCKSGKNSAEEEESEDDHLLLARSTHIC